MSVAIWSVGGEQPVRLVAHDEFVESHLEEWIEHEPSLVMDGLTWIARQPVLPDRSRPDLIGLSREGSLVVAELKRGVLNVAALSQALHYVLWLGSLKGESLVAWLTQAESEARSLVTSVLEGTEDVEISVLLVGTGRLPELDDAASFLTARGLNVPVKIVTFTSVKDSAGQVLLARHVEDHDVAADELTPAQRSSRAASVEKVRELAREIGAESTIDCAIEIAGRLGLRVRPWPRSITIIPHHARGRTLVYVGPREQGVYFEYSLETLADLYNADPSTVEAFLGPNSVQLPASQVVALLRKFEDLMIHLQTTPPGTDDNQTDDNQAAPLAAPSELTPGPSES